MRKGLEALLRRSPARARVRLHRGELDRAKRSVLASYERAYAEREKTESRGYAREYVGNFLDDEPMPGIAYEYELTKALLPGITLAEVRRGRRESCSTTTAASCWPRRPKKPASRCRRRTRFAPCWRRRHRDADAVDRDAVAGRNC